jgi:NADH dehydrogenase [ubiquinone] 1 alpha subcomplex assembly factor 7
LADGAQNRVSDFAALLAARCPMTVHDWMEACLADPEHGYYRKGARVGRDGDFVTAPEISQIFGELLGLFLAQAWIDQGAPSNAVLAELGPGRGTLMDDSARAFEKATKARPAVHLVEINQTMRAEQAIKLAGRAPVWHDRVDDLPDAPLFLMANEFFDALPVRQYRRVGAAWRERIVTKDFAFADGAEVPAPVAHDVPDGAIVETCPARQGIARALGERIARRGGAALIADYGSPVSGWGDTLQAVRGHAKVSVFDRPGETDLTAQVDFQALGQAAEAGGCAAHGACAQGDFLRRMGAHARAASLIAANPGKRAEIERGLARLIAPSEMGRVFRVLALLPDGFAPPVPMDGH